MLTHLQHYSAFIISMSFLMLLCMQCLWFRNPKPLRFHPINSLLLLCKMCRFVFHQLYYLHISCSVWSFKWLWTPSPLDDELIRTNPRLILWCLLARSGSAILLCSFLSALIKTMRLLHLSESSSDRCSLPRHIRPISGGAAAAAAAGVPSTHCQPLGSDVRRRHRRAVVATVSWEREPHCNLQQ